MKNEESQVTFTINNQAIYTLNTGHSTLYINKLPLSQKRLNPKRRIQPLSYSYDNYGNVGDDIDG